jgi:PAS domain S-box-containing protein
MHLAAIVQGSDDAIFSKDLDGVILSWNGGAQRMYGYSAEEAVGRDVTLLVPEELHPEIDHIMECIRRGEPVDHHLTRRRHKDGHLLDVSVTISPVKEEGGRIVGASTIARDVTERIRYTRELEEKNAQLQRVNAALERFAYVAAHDLKEPLRTMSAYAELLQSKYGKQMGEDADEIIGFIVDGSARLHALIRDLLVYSRVGQHRDVTVVAPEPVLAGALQDLHAEIEQRQAQVTHGPMPPVRADAGELRQVLVHLLGNALKFSPTVPRVHVSAERVDGEVRFSVTDNGIGIPAEQRERVFVLFKRLRPAQYEGTGVGLAICRKIVEESGGRIWVEDASGGGSTFVFTLPHAPS